jgi:hypothetical protein
MKFCKDCANISGPGAVDGKCNAPAGQEFADRVTGEPPSASSMRNDPMGYPGEKKPSPRCGSKGEWFKPQEGANGTT